MDNIHDNRNPHAMGCINQFFQFFRSTKAGRSGKETGNMVSEATIIGMFLDSHNLYAVVAFLGDTWKNLFLKFLIATDLFLLLRHTDMAFIYQ